MKLYVVHTYEYGDTLCGAFTSKEKAKEAIKIMKIQDDIDNNFTMEEWEEEFIISEIILDKIYDIIL